MGYSMNSTAWIKKLQNMDRHTLCSYKLSEFITNSRSAFLSSEVIMMLDELEKSTYIKKDQLADLYVLAFVYRNTAHFEEIVKGNHISPPLLISFDDQNEKDCNLPEKEQGDILDLIISLNGEKNGKARLFMDKLSNLSKEAEYFREKMRVIFEKYLKSKNREITQHEKKFIKVYRKEVTEKCNVSQLLKEVKPKDEGYEAFRRRYYRWKNDLENLPCFDSKWPTDEFLWFCAFLSVKYTQETYKCNFFILDEVPGIEVNQIYRALHRSMQGRIRNNLLEMTMNYTVKMDNKYSKDKEKRLRQLARKNYLPAIKEYIKMLSPRMQKSYLIRAAILGDEEIQQSQGWQANGFRNLKLEVCSRNMLRVTEILDLVSGSPIEPMSILEFIKFPMITNSEEWFKIYDSFKNCKITPLESNFPVYYSPNTNKTVIWETVSIKATAYNFNILMKNANSLLLNHVEVCFSSQHNKKATTVNAELFRDNNVEILNFINKLEK